jgi:hypothetical protein
MPAYTLAVPALVAAAGERARAPGQKFVRGAAIGPARVRVANVGGEKFEEARAGAGVPSIGAVQPVHIATWIEAGTRELAAPSVKQRLFDWLVTGQVVPVNPAASVRGPRHVVTSGQTPVLDPVEARALLDSIDTANG